MSTPSIAPADLGLPSFDECPACECHCHDGREVPAAALRAKCHGSLTVDLYACCDYTIALCETCFEVFQHRIETVLAAACARARCGGCGRQLVQLSDVIMAVIRL